MCHCAVSAGLQERRRILLLFHETPAEISRRLVAIPIERRSDDQTLRRLQTECVNVGDVEKQSRKLLATFGQTEFARLLNRIDCVATGVCKGDHLCARSLRLQ